MEKVIVTMADVRAVQQCSGGARKFFNRYNLDYGAFLRDGVPADVLRRTGDALAEPAIENAERRMQAQNREG